MASYICNKSEAFKTKDLYLYFKIDLFTEFGVPTKSAYTLSASSHDTAAHRDHPQAYAQLNLQLLHPTLTFPFLPSQFPNFLLISL